MSQILRFHPDRALFVPRAVVDGVDWLVGVSDGCAEDYGLHACEACDLERFVVVRPGTGPVFTDALTVSRARNVLDGILLGYEPEMPDGDEHRT